MDTKKQQTGYGGKRQGSGRKPEGLLNASVLGIRCKNHQKLQLKANAEKENKSVSQYILDKCL